jgi:hypothetical protein
MKKFLFFLTVLFFFYFSAFGQSYTQPGGGYLLNGAVRTMATLPAPNSNQIIYGGLFTQAGSISSPKLINYNATTDSYTAISGTNSTLDINGTYIGSDGLFRVYGKGQIAGLHYGVFKFTNPTTVVPDTYFQFTGPNAASQKIEAADCNGSETIIVGKTLAEVNGVALNHAGNVSNTGVVTNIPQMDAGSAEIKRIVWDAVSSNYKITGQFNTLGATNSPKFAIFDGTTVTPVTGASDGSAYCVDYDVNSQRIGWTNNSPSSGGGNLTGNNATAFSSNWLVLTQDILEYQGETFFIGFPKGTTGPSNRSAVASWDGSSWTNRSYNLQYPNPSSNSGVLCGAVANGCLFVGGNLAPPNSECYIVGKICLSGPLPIKLTSFTGRNTEKGNEISWETESEVNNAFFEIERSDDCLSFEKIGLIKGENRPSNYSFLDKNPEENNYYRLKQNDFDGKFEFSKTIFLKNKDFSETKVYPNPFVEELNIETNEIDIAVYDNNGNLVSGLTNLNENSILNLNLSHLKKGTYTLKIGKNTKRIVKVE